MSGITAQTLADHVGGVVISGDGQRQLSGVSTPDHAGPTDLIFVASSKFSQSLMSSSAGAVLVADALNAPAGMTVIRVAQPTLAMAQAIDLLVPMAKGPAGISERATLGEHADVAPDAGIGPGCHVGDRTRIGARTTIRSGATIGNDVIVGDDCLIYPGVHIYDGVRIGSRVILHAGCVIGADGFGYVPEPIADGQSTGEPFRYRKIRQVGTVVIEDDVEIGANTTIDRAMLHETRIGRGTKIDNQVMVGHNSVVGRHCVIVSQVGLSGSTSLGDYVTIAGQAGIIGHVHIGDHAVIGSQAGVTRDVPPGARMFGAPAVDAKVAARALPIVAQLPELRKLVRSLNERVAALEQAGTPAPGDE